MLIRIYLNEPVEVGEIPFTKYATVHWFGAVMQEATPAEVPELDWSDEYRPALYSLVVKFPDTETLR